DIKEIEKEKEEYLKNQDYGEQEKNESPKDNSEEEIPEFTEEDTEEEPEFTEDDFDEKMIEKEKKEYEEKKKEYEVLDIF
ncbi:MAG: hypothetical protein Q8P15_03480, partial [Nanoarchaeota archaeon]|nr:hypothetical protein [Nanoarchaeota archaeon]